MNGWRYASIKGRTDKSKSTTALCGPSGATTCFPQHWQHARTCRVSDLPTSSGALQVWVGLVGGSPPPVPQAKKKKGDIAAAPLRTRQISPRSAMLSTAEAVTIR